MVDLDNVLAQLDAHQGSSVEKLTDLLAAVQYLDPGEDEQAAQKLAVFNMLAPTITPMLPQDPGELDRMLEMGAQLFVALRSCEAEPLSILGAQPAAVHQLGEMSGAAE